MRSSLCILVSLSRSSYNVSRSYWVLTDKREMETCCPNQPVPRELCCPWCYSSDSGCLIECERGFLTFVGASVMLESNCLCFYTSLLGPM